MLILSLVLALDLRLELVRESLTGTHYRYRQYVDGEPVIGGEVNVSIRADGSREESREIASEGERPSSVHLLSSTRLVNVNGIARRAREETTYFNDFLRVVRYVDVETNEVIREERLFATGRAARVFDPNPVAALNDPALQDQNNSAGAVPEQAYRTVDLVDVRESGPLGGPFAQIADLQNPAIAPVDASSSLMLDRSQTGFEDVNAYYHVDQTQRYLQKLGYTGARAVAAYPIEIDAHAANGSDNSFFISTSPGRGVLYFGDGGTDDAEDSDLVNHEYAHAIHDWISPGTFFGSFASQARAVSEGFGDYWAFSQTYEKATSIGRDPFCFADWDARCGSDAPEERCGYPPGADCLRRLDSAKTIADFASTDTSGTEHRNGEIWSSALREIFLAVGKPTTDTIVVESFFGAGPNPSFASMARRMIAADQILSGGANANVICAAMRKRGILADCLTVPRGELTFFQAPQRGVTIPDNDPAGVTLRTVITDPRFIERLFVNVNIAHQSRGDLRIVLIAPDGSEFVLQEASLDRTRDVNAIYGRDTIPAQPLDPLRGRVAAGEWKLRVSDVRALDRGTVMSWSLVIQFAGDPPLQARPSGLPRQVIPAATHAPGANGTYFVTDLRLFNREARDGTAALIFGRSESDFAAIKVVVPRGEVVALDDVVGVAMQTAGGGQLEIQGDVIATSRTYTRNDHGTFGQFIPAMTVAGIPPVTTIPQIQNNNDFRSNIGFAEVSGASGSVQVVIFDAFNGSILASDTYSISPFGHVQIPVRPRADMMTVDVRVAGNAQVLAYASVIDNRTGDPIFVPAERIAEARVVSAPVISDIGANDTFWRSDVWVTGIAGTDGIGRIVPTFSDARDGTQTVRSIPTPAGRRAFVLYDVLVSVFQRRGMGLLSLVLPPAFIVTSRTFNGDDVVTGTFGQFIPFTDTPSKGPLDLIHVESSAPFRTNIGLWSPETGTARVTIFDSAGEAVEQHDLALLPMRLIQFPVTATVVNGRARIEVLSGQVIAYASMIDNVSGDSIFVPAQ